MAHDWNSTILQTGARLTEGTLGRRLIAYAIDVVIIALLFMVFKIAVSILGIVTFGLAWLAFAVPMLVIAVLYSALTIASSAQGTWGMRAVGLRLIDGRTGGTVPLIHAAAHSLLFYVAAMSFVLLLCDIGCGVLRSDSRIARDLIVGVVATRS